MKYIKPFLLLFITSFFSFTTHKYYLSLTQIEYVEEKQSVQIILQVFIDDIEVAINKTYNVNAQLNTKKELKKINPYFKEYITKNLLININNQQKKYHFIGKEYEGDLVYFYLEIENTKKINTLKITNTVLTEYFEDQQNLIKIKANGTYKSKLLSKKNNKALLNF